MDMCCFWMRSWINWPVCVGTLLWGGRTGFMWDFQVTHEYVVPPSLDFSQVTLMLLDHNNREHVIDAFRPDVTSSSFQRPVSDMNIASGCPLFCPVSKMEAKNSYVRDDAIFIKAIVDLTGL